MDPSTIPSLLQSAAQAFHTGQYDHAIGCMVRVVQLAPNEPRYRIELGSLAGQLGLTDLSIDNLRRAIELAPAHPAAHNDLGQALCQARRVGEAIECFRRAVTLKPDYLVAASNQVYYAHFDPTYDGNAIRSAAVAWAQRYAEPLTNRACPFATDRSPDRPLRIGYVSPDLYEHPVGRFLHAILAHHDRGQFHAICYSGCTAPDSTTTMLKSLSGDWRDVTSLTDDALADQIRADRVDILIDLSLHMAGNRLLTFARRPAPVQVTYLGYAGSSGMSAMDWRISDAHLDPPGNEAFYTERTKRLPRSYWCYTPPTGVGEVAPRRPAPITFGCTNSLFKVSDAALVAWGEIFRRAPDSRLLIHAQPGRHQLEMLKLLNCPPQRVRFAPSRPFLDYFRGYEEIDILLDPFPYAGGTTSCDAMWMGVPVVTLAGKIAVHRGGVSLLSNLGLNDLIAPTIESYISAAVGLASSREKLADLRSTLRQRMTGSILLNPPEFTRDFESALREIWRESRPL